MQLNDKALRKENTHLKRVRGLPLDTPNRDIIIKLWEMERRKQSLAIEIDRKRLSMLINRCIQGIFSMQAFSQFFQNFSKPKLQQSKTTKWKSGGFPMFTDNSGQLWICLFVSNNEYYGGRRPQMPKGHPDKGEKPVVVGAREASEETGIPLKALMKNPISVISKSFNGAPGTYLMHVYAFPLDKKYPAKINNEGKGVWLKYEDALTAIRRDQITFLLSAQRKIYQK